MSIDWKIIEPEAFEALRRPKARPRTDPVWEEIIDALQNGAVVQFPFSNEKELRGKRLSVSRRASKRGFKVELRYGDDFVAAKKLDTSRVNQSSKPRRKKVSAENAD